jgi:hypothetical protein
MTLVMKCDDKDRLVAYLYGEDTPGDRAAVEAHLARCAGCAAELASLRGVRTHLAEWQPPEVDLGFRVVRDAATPAPARRWWALPVWAHAAAALLVLSAGAALANLDVRYGADGLRVRTGWHSNDSNDSNNSNDSNLADLERRLRAEFTHAIAAAPAARPVTAPVQPAPVRGVGDDEVLRQVRALIAESERRQQRELALRLTDVVRDFDAQRRADLVRIEQNMGQIEGLTGAEALRQRQLLDYLVRVSQQR